MLNDAPPESGRSFVTWRSFSGEVYLAALLLIAAGWLGLVSGIGVWLWAIAAVLLGTSCVTSKSWRGAAIRMVCAAAVLVTFPLVFNLTVYVLDLLGIVHSKHGGTQPARLR